MNLPRAHLKAKYPLIKAAQQSVHPVSASLRGANCLTMGTAVLEGGVRTSQAVFYALAFFWLDGFAVPAPAQVSRKERMGRAANHRMNLIPGGK
jgi:hypothetical protein